MKDLKVSRRTVLLGTTVGAASALLPSLEASAADIGVSVLPFPLSAVTLQPGPFQANRDRTLSYLSFVDADRLLHTFRLNVGLASSAQPVGGWESPTTELRGHSTGHLLTALAQAYASTGNATYKTKGDYIVSVLAQCQSRAAQAGFNTGYLSAYPESFIDRVEARQTVWAPYYTLHKIMQGLLDMYLLAGNTQALNVLTAQGAWVKFRNDRLTQTQRQNMLDTAADATGNGKTATVAGGGTWIAGRIGNAVNLSGTSQYVSMPAGILAGASACTIATWVRLDTIANWVRIFDLDTGATANMFLTARSSSGTARFAITSSGAGGEQRINAPAALPTGAWTHVAVTLSGGTGILYVNKAEVARASVLSASEISALP